MKYVTKFSLIFLIFSCTSVNYSDSYADIRNDKLTEKSSSLIHKNPVSENLKYSQDECLEMLSTNVDGYLICIQNYQKYSRQELNIQIREAANFKEQQEQQKLAVINALKTRCISYGFSGETNIAACIQREAQHDYEIEQKEYQMRLAQRQKMNNKNEQQIQQDVPWFLFILEAVAEGIEEGYKQKALIQNLDTRYEQNDIYRYCRPNC